MLANKNLIFPGFSIGSITVHGDYEQDAEGTLAMELTSASSFDKFVVTGNATLGGTLEVILLDFSAQPGDSFDILDWETVTGTFDTLQLPMLGGGLTWDTDQLYTLGVLAIGGVLGDYNLDSIVDAADYVLWRESVGQIGSGLATDGNRNDMVDAGDYDVWREHFGQSVGAGAAAIPTSSPGFAVPEPTVSVLLFMICLTTCGNVRRRARTI